MSKAATKGKKGGRKVGGSAPAKKDSLKARLAKIRARHERPSVVYESDDDNEVVYKTRFLRLNALLGGGIRRGAIVEMYALEDSGKSTSAAAIAADIQRQAPKGKNTVLLVNFELVIDYDWLRTQGLDTNEEGEHPAFIHLQPKSLEEGVADAVELIESGEVCVAIFDSVYAADSRAGRDAIKAWADAKGKKAGIAVEARAWGQAWTTLKGLFKEYGCVAIAVNQAREDMEMGGAPKKGFSGPKLMSTRGRALKFYAWVRLEMSATNLDPEKYPEVDGRHVRFKVIKNKTSADARGRVSYDLIRGEGFDLAEDLIELALEAGAIVGGGGGFFTIKSTRIRGREKLKALVQQSEKLRSYLSLSVEKYLAKKVADEGLEAVSEKGGEDEVATNEGEIDLAAEALEGAAAPAQGEGASKEEGEAPEEE